LDQFPVLTFRLFLNLILPRFDLKAPVTEKILNILEKLVDNERRNLRARGRRYERLDFKRRQGDPA
jgi:hypothetical protein